MTSLNQDIKEKLNNLSVFEKVIILNLVIYVVGWFISRLNGIPQEISLSWLELPKDASDFISQPWAILTYGFTHVKFWHLFFNMLVLYFIGRSFANLFDPKLSLSVYLLGIITGALAFLLVFNLFPEGLLKKAGALVGASAGVRAILLFLVAYMPNYEFQLGTLRIKLLYVGVLLVFLDIPGFFADNAGGTVAHFGGYLLGLFYALQLRKGNDIGKGFGGLVDNFLAMFSLNKKTRLKTVYKSKKKKTYAGLSKEEFDEFNNQKQIDIILDKISKSGYDSLTAEEKEFLFRSGKK